MDTSSQNHNHYLCLKYQVFNQSILNNCKVCLLNDSAQLYFRAPLQMMSNILSLQTHADILDPATQWLLPCRLMAPYYHFYVLKKFLLCEHDAEAAAEFFFFNQIWFNKIPKFGRVRASSADASNTTSTNITPLSNPAHKLPAFPNLPLM